MNPYKLSFAKAVDTLLSHVAAQRTGILGGEVHGGNDVIKYNRYRNGLEPSCPGFELSLGSWRLSHIEYTGHHRGALEGMLADTSKLIK